MVWEALLIVGVVFVILFLVGTRRSSTINTLGQADSRPVRGRPDSQRSTSFRPSSTSRRASSLPFYSSTKHGSTESLDIVGLHDAFTGEPLNLSLGLHQCKQCKVYYHSSSLDVVRLENGGRCVGCRAINSIIAVLDWQFSDVGRENEAQVVTIHDYHDHVGRVITFEGYVPRVNVSRDGRSYAVMFENTSWSRGLKMCVFKRDVRSVGGAQFLKGLKHKRIQVRGLLTNHPQFGFQIIVTTRSMIQSVQ